MYPTGNYKALVYSYGAVLWVPKLTVSAACETNLRHFPYDEHECFIKFGSWTHDGFMMDVKFTNENNTEKNIRLDSMEDTSNEWKLVRYSAERNEKYYSCCVEPYPDVTFKLFLQRQSPYYTLTIVVPCILVLFLILASFWLPPAAEEKITLSCFNVLYLVIMLGHLHLAVPKSGLHVPNIVKFCGSLGIVAIISLVSNVITVAMSRRHQVSSPLRCCQMIFGCRFIKLCCLTPQNFEEPHLLASSNAEGSQEESKPSEPPKLMDYMFIATAVDRIMFYVTVVMAIAILIYSFHN